MMDDVLFWFWTSVLAATVLWWLMMIIRVAFIGPFELRDMFRSLNRSSENEDEPTHTSA